MIELLVVIAIIAILAAILFPAFARARENARRASCQSNLKQIGLGILQYTQDYDEKYPMRYYGRPGGGAQQEVFSWRRTTFPYTKSSQLYACPSNTQNAGFSQDSDPPSMTAVGLNPNSDPRFPRSYAINGTTDNGGTPPSEYASSLNLAAVPSTSETILVSEYAYTDAFVNWNGYTVNPFLLNFFAFPGHLQTSNFLFCDGHVKAMKPIATITPNNLWTTEERDGPPTTAAIARQIPDWQTLMNKS